MAVGKRVPADSSIDARKSADQLTSATTAPAAEQAPAEPRLSAGFHDLEATVPGWNLHLLRMSVALLAGFEILYFAADFLGPPPLTPANAALHAAAIGSTLCVFALTYSRWFERHWRLVCFANLIAIYVLTFKLRLLTGDVGPLGITLTLTLIGTGALLEWSARWQAGLSAIALATAVMPQLIQGPFDRLSAYRYFGVALGVALGHFILATRTRYRAQLAQWMDRLRASHRELAQALAESAAVMAEREQAERSLRESEAMLRTVFDALPDCMTITRMADGATLEVNREFLKTGYTREEVLGTSTFKLGRWPRPQFRELVRELRTHGNVRNLEAELRNKDGRIVPSLVSATMVELAGEQCVISVAHDISVLKRAQRELSAAREALAVELRKLELNQRQLVSSEGKLRMVLEATGDTIALNRLQDGCFLDVNPAFCEALGYTRADALGQSALELGLWCDPEQLRHFLRLLKTDGRVRNLECTFRRKDGGPVEHLVSASLIRLNGESCIVSATRDVSEIKRAERELRAVREALSSEVRELEASQGRLRVEIAQREAAQRQLRQSEENLRSVFEASLDSMTVKRLRDGRYIEVNRAFEALFCPREEALGKTAEELKFWAEPEKFKVYDHKLRTEGLLRNLESEFNARDGRIIQVLISAVVVEIGGEPCVVSIARDISEIRRTERELRAVREALSAEVRELEANQIRLRSEVAERERAQSQLRQSEKNLRRIFDADIDAITIKRLRDGRYVEVNQAFEVFGYTQEEARGKTAEELGIWADPRQLAAFTEKIAREGRVSNFETLCRTRNGATIPSLVSATVVELGGEPSVASFVRNISALKQTEHELTAARDAALAGSEAKSQFLSVMSHEIRTPMNAIFGMAELLWETPLTGEQRLYLETMRNNSTSLLNLIDGILDLSKVESGRLSLEYADFDLAELAEGATETLAPRAYEKGLELALRIPCAIPTAFIGDPLRLRQILINLLSNAIKFTERGEVILTIEAVDDAQTGAEGAVAAAPGPAAVKRQSLRFVRDRGAEVHG